MSDQIVEKETDLERVQRHLNALDAANDTGIATLKKRCQNLGNAVRTVSRDLRDVAKVALDALERAKANQTQMEVLERKLDTLVTTMSKRRARAEEPTPAEKQAAITQEIRGPFPLKKGGE